LHGSTAAKDEREEIDTAILPASSPEILPYIRLKNVTASVTNCRGRVIFEAIASQRKWKDDASKSSCNPFFNRLKPSTKWEISCENPFSALLTCIATKAKLAYNNHDNKSIIG
jgi:hypothetical protein